MRHSMRRSGFTLIEILIVIVFVSLLSGLAVPKVGLGKFRSDAAARLVVSIAQQAGRLALQRQYDVIVSFDTTRHRVRVVEDQNNNGAVDAGERVTWRTLEERERFATPPTGLTGQVSAPVVGNALDAVDGMPSVTFHRDGSASTDAELYVTTGRLMWSRYTGSSWTEVGR